MSININEKMQKKIQEVLNALPDWADGAASIDRSSWAGHGDVVMWTEFMPVKKYYKYGLRLWYYYTEWKEIMKPGTGFPISASADFPAVIITRDGRIVRYRYSHQKEEWRAGKWIYLEEV
mgnify:CR=1 FL=1